MVKLKQLLAQLVTLVEREPAVVAYSLAAALVPILVSRFHWDTGQAAAAAAIGTALASVVAAIHARPISVTAVTGAAVAIGEYLAAWHVKIPAADMSLIVGLITVLLGQTMRVNLTTRTTIRRRAAAAVREHVKATQL